MIKKLKYKKSILFVSFLIALIFLLNSLLSSFIQHKLSELLLMNDSEYYTTSIENVKFKLIDRSITLNQIFLSPTSQFSSEIKNGTAGKNEMLNISISTIKLERIDYLKLIFSKSVSIKNLLVKDLLIQKFENIGSRTIKKNEQTTVNLDSLHLKSIGGIEIQKFEFENFKYQSSNLKTGKITFQNSPLSFKTSGLKLVPYENELFRLKPIDDLFELHDIALIFDDIHYEFLMDRMKIDFNQKTITLQQVQLRTTMDKVALANTYKYNTEVFNLSIKDLNIYNFNVNEFLNQGGIFIDSLAISEMDIDLYKDKRKPFDQSKRPKLPHIALKNSETRINIPKIRLEGGNLAVEERLDKRNLSMKISIDDIEAELTNITSLKALRNQPMKVQIKAKFMGYADLTSNMNFSLKDHENNFDFNGYLGPAKMKLFDSALFPVLGLKVLKGDLDGLTFNATANNVSSSGKMSFLYHNLEAEVFKSDSKEENKFLSWTVNNVVRESNPGNNKVIRVVPMNHERVVYKGLGGFFWKTIQSGIINTIAPFGFKTEKPKKEKRKSKKNKKS